MSEEEILEIEEEEEAARQVEVEALRPKAPSKLAPQGIRTFTVYRRNDESKISGTGVVIEGCVFATGQCVVHWLYPPPRGSVAFFESMDDFVKVHIGPHPVNKTIITFQDGEQICYGVTNEADET